MSSYIDIKFLNLLSTRLPKFKRKSDNLFNFRCPHCGDSQKSASKARGFVYRKKNDMFFKCHNCGMGQTLGNLIKFLDLKWEKDCLNPQDNNRAVFTSAKTQIRNKIYKNSSEEWKKFKPYLNGIFDDLNNKL